jgi:leucyl aminopeptidase
MKLETAVLSPTSQPFDIPLDCLVIFVSNTDSTKIKSQPKMAGSLKKILDCTDLSKTNGSTLLAFYPNHFQSKRILFVRLTEQSLHTKLADAINNAVDQITQLEKISTVGWLVSDELTQDFETAKLFGQVLGKYTYQRAYTKTKDKAKDKKSFADSTHLFWLTQEQSDLTAFQAGLSWGFAVSEGVNFARYLADMPANYCTPTFLAKSAENLAKSTKQSKITCQVLKPNAIKKLKMESFLSVSKGSDEEPRFIVLDYQGTSKDSTPPIVLVGKGITFDSGGISLKPAASMDEMKYDMSGAAAVLGTFKTISKAKLPIRVIGLIPACENLPSGRANKPGDVVTSMNGLTIEILNTDAEGRLILCDALTYAERYQPKYVVDIATLTGAIITSLGHLHSGLFSPHDLEHDQLARDLIIAGENSLDTCWRMPMDEEYQKLLKSKSADLANIGGSAAGSVTAACFLSNFTEKYIWAHLDIAGTAWNSGKEKAATGRPVPLLTEFLRQQSMSSVKKGPLKKKKLTPSKKSMG